MEDTFFKSKVFTWIALIFFLPVGVYLLYNNEKYENKKYKWLVVMNILIIDIIFFTVIGFEIGNRNKNFNKLITTDLNKDSTEEVSENKLEVNITIDEVFEKGGVSFSITSNLPNGVKGNIMLQSDDVNYKIEQKIILIDGTTSTYVFTDDGYDLKRGSYKVILNTYFYNDQPKEVQDVIGKNYSQIKTPYLENDEKGTRIHVEKNINIYGDESGFLEGNVINFIN